MSLEGRDPRARYALDACRTRHWKERTGYVKPSRENGENGPQNGHRRRSGRQISYRKAVDEVAFLLMHVVPLDAERARTLAESALHNALPERQR